MRKRYRVTEHEVAEHAAATPAVWDAEWECRSRQNSGERLYNCRAAWYARATATEGKTVKASEALGKIFHYSSGVETARLDPEDGDEIKQDLIDRGFVILLDQDDFIVFALNDFELEA